MFIFIIVKFSIIPEQEDWFYSVVACQQLRKLHIITDIIVVCSIGYRIPPGKLISYFQGSFFLVISIIPDLWLLYISLHTFHMYAFDDAFRMD